MHLLLGILVAIIMFAVMVAVHEGGHFFAARAVGVKVNEFSIGMGPLLFKREKNGTEYSLRAFPVGGYCALEGEDTESDDEHAFHNRPAWAKAIVLVAGPFMNFVLAFVILSVLITYIGTSATAVLSSVEKDSPAYAAGLRAEDTITEVDGKATPDGKDVREAIHAAAESGDSVTVTYEKPDGNIYKKEIAFTIDENNNKVIGVLFQSHHNVLTGIKQGFVSCFVMEKEMLVVLGKMIIGQGSAQDVVGPVGIVKVVDQTTQAGLLNILYLTALLSLNLGLVNILPFPALDGGRLLFVLIRAVTGRMITDEMENRIHYAGILILFMLMILITLKDIHTFILN